MKSALIIATLIAATLGAPTYVASWRRQAGGNFQTFTGALGGIAATPVTDSGIANRQFQVKGDTFVKIGAALARSCDQQFNACANAANGGDATLSVSQCSGQKGMSAIGKAKATRANEKIDQCDAASSTSASAAQGNAGNAGNTNAGNAGNANAENANNSEAGKTANNANGNGAAPSCNAKRSD
jgi:hypothetical protein